MSDVVEARLRLIIALLRSHQVPPAEIAEEARRLFEAREQDGESLTAGHPAAEGLSEEHQHRMSKLHSLMHELRPLWERYTDGNPFFEKHLLDEMSYLLWLVIDTTSLVRRRALDALQDPKNWPFDPDLSPQHETNLEAAQAHGVKFDPWLRQYLDEDGCPRFDAFGQPL
jgi:hypothetical protein